MKSLTLTCLIALALAFGFFSVTSSSQEEWAGVDEAVVEKIAVEAGRPPKDPLINTDKGDLLLFVFLCAGAIGGFSGGYCFRGLFPPKGVEQGG